VNRRLGGPLSPHPVMVSLGQASYHGRSTRGELSSASSDCQRRLGCALFAAKSRLASNYASTLLLRSFSWQLDDGLGPGRLL
jgi:hypothetical protein